jgi:hypothetical protein
MQLSPDWIDRRPLCSILHSSFFLLLSNFLAANLDQERMEIWCKNFLGTDGQLA